MAVSVIVFDPNEAVRTAATDALSAIGFDGAVMVASVDELAAALPRLGAPCVLLVDVDGGDNIVSDVISSVRATQPSASAVAMTSARLVGVPNGIDAVLNKPFSTDALQQIVAAEIMRQGARRIGVHVVTVQAVDRNNPTPYGVRCGGTGCLLRIGERRMLLTAKHVIDALQDPALYGILGGNGQPVGIQSWRTIDSDAGIDVATVEVPDDFDPQLITKDFYSPPTWPMPRVERGQVVFFLGFAGIHRVADRDRLLNYSATFCDFVSSTSSRHFVLADEGLERSVTEFLRGMPPFGPTGGLSGAPVFVNRGGRLDLAGVLYEGDDSPSATFFVAHSDFVRSDGTIDRGLPR